MAMVAISVSINNSLSILERSSLSLAAQTLARESGPRLSPCLASFLLPPSRFPHSPYHSPSKRGATNKMESQAQLSQKHRSQAQCLQYSQAAWCPSTSLRVYRTAESTTTEGTPVAYRRRPTALDTQKRQRQKHAQNLQQLTRAGFPGDRFPAKLDANQSN